MIQDKPRSITRTWTVTTAHEMDRVVVMITTHTVTLSADHAGYLTAQVDGQPSTPQRADHLLRTAARRTLVGETRTWPLLPVPAFPWVGHRHLYLPAYTHDLLQKLITQALCQSPAVPVTLILLALPGLLLEVLS